MWNSEDQPRTAAARRLAQRVRSTLANSQTVLDVPGLRVFHVRGPGTARRAYPLARDAGVVLGKLFDDSFAPADPEFGDAETTRLLESQGRYLTERYWGHYVAFLQAADGGPRFVLRDPTGGLPCYVTRTSGIDVFLSDMEDYARLELAPFAPDREHLTAFFLYSELATRSTGVAGVTQLYPGECAAVCPAGRNGGIDYSFYWNAADLAATCGPDDVDEARSILGSTVRRSVGAWASSYRRIVQEVSGGLDSSIVGACVAAARPSPEVLGFHFFARTAQGDERTYARAAAERAGFELIEAECASSSTSLREQLDPLRVASPAVLGFLPESERLRRRLVRLRRAEAVFTGQGGDHLFQQAGGELIAAAERAGFELIEAECASSSTSLREQLDPLRVASPAVLGFLPESERLRRRLVRLRRAEAVFTGQGGDHLFQQAGGELIAAEYLERRGLRPALSGVVADACRLSQLPVWSVLAAAVNYGLFRRRFDPYEDYAEPPPILCADAGAALNPQAWSHPWLEKLDALPAVKVRQVFNVVDCQTFYLRPCPYAELIHPLLSQPIVECSLQIPSYVLAHRGNSRGLIREAFAADLPERIVQRYSKGGATSYFNRMLRDNAAFLREFLLDGTLAREGILDRRELETRLSESALVIGNDTRSLLDAVRAEAWLHAWTSERTRVAA